MDEERDAIDQHQLAALRMLLGAIIPTNKFYARKLGATPIDITSIEQFNATVPFTTKQELSDDQAAHPPYGTNLTFPLDSYTRSHQTSGTTSAPLRWLDTAESWEWMLENWREIFAAAGVTAQDRIFFAFSFGPFIGFWLAFEAAVRLGALCIPGGGMSSAARVRSIIENQATVLCCTPTYAVRLAEIGVEGSRVKRILVAGEPGGSVPAIRARIEQGWPGATVYDHHGMTEAGPVTYQCPDHPGVLHVLERAYLAEVIDPRTGLASNEGELILTTLGRIGSPLLRYRTGDFVKQVRCACGRSDMALQGGILGRTDDMIIVRGVNVYPMAVERIIMENAGAAEYQVKVSSALREISVLLELPPEQGAVQKRVEHSLQTALGLRVPVRRVEPGTLPRSELKTRRWVKE